MANTKRLKDSVAVLIPSVALMIIIYSPLSPESGIKSMIPIPFPSSENTPKAGRPSTERMIALVSVHNAHTRLVDAKKKVNDKKTFSDNNPELFPDSTKIDFNSDEDEEQNEDEIVYENPSLKNGPHNKIICGERVDIAKQLLNAFVNLICFPPDYN